MRKFIAVALGVTACTMLNWAVPVDASAQDDYPARTIVLVVPTSPGRSGDASARLLARSMAKTLGQPVVVENKPGAGGAIGLKYVVDSKPDGYTLSWYFEDGLSLSPLSLRVPPFDAVRDFTHIGTVIRANAFMIAANPNTLPVKSFDELVKLAKTRQVSFATFGTGGVVNLGFEIINENRGLTMLNVPYKSGSDGELAALGGQVDLVAGTSFVETLRSGRLTPLAVGGNTRNPQLPNVPTLAELGLGDVIFGPINYGLAAAKGTPKTVVDKIHAAAQIWLNEPGTKEQLAKLNMEPALSSADDVINSIRQTQKFYLPVIKRLGIVID